MEQLKSTPRQGESWISDEPTYLALDVLGLVLVVVVLHAQLQLLDERFLRVLV